MKVSVDVLRMILDLPEHLRIIEVLQSPDDSVRGVCSVLLTGPYCPEWEEGSQPRELELVFRRVDPYGAELETIVGLDT